MRLLSVLTGKQRTASGKRAARKTATTRHRPRLDWLTPRRALAAGIVGCVATIGVLLGLMWRDGTLARYAENVNERLLDASARAGLVIEDVLVRGRQQTNADDLRLALGVGRGTPILSVDLETARARVEALGWVKSVHIERRLPNLIYVSLTERRPMGRWQRNGRLRLVDEEGAVITASGLSAYGHLPIIIGQDAPPRAHKILKILNREAELSRRVHAVSWVGNRRWTVALDNGIEVQLPEKDPSQAWARLAAMEREHKVLASNILTIDLRLPTFPMVKVTPDTARRLRNPGKET